jgi:hypothetical protein
LKSGAPVSVLVVPIVRGSDRLAANDRRFGVGQPEAGQPTSWHRQATKVQQSRRSLSYFRREFFIPDDPNNKQNEGSGSSGQTGQQSGQKRDISNESQKRPQSGPESEQDRGQNDQGGQRRAS